RRDGPKQGTQGPSASPGGFGPPQRGQVTRPASDMGLASVAGVHAVRQRTSSLIRRRKRETSRPSPPRIDGRDFLTIGWTGFACPGLYSARAARPGTRGDGLSTTRGTQFPVGFGANSGKRTAIRVLGAATAALTLPGLTDGEVPGRLLTRNRAAT